MEQVVTNYFRDLFTVSMVEIDDVIVIVHQCLTKDHNDSLLAPFKVKHTLFKMHPDKAPRMDGMNPTLYQSF